MCYPRRRLLGMMPRAGHGLVRLAGIPSATARGPSLLVQHGQCRVATRVRMCGTSAQLTVVETCRQKIAAKLDTTVVKVQGAFDDPNGSHITIYCVSKDFEGKRSLGRQQLVFKAIWDEMQGQYLSYLPRRRPFSNSFPSAPCALQRTTNTTRKISVTSTPVYNA